MSESRQDEHSYSVLYFKRKNKTHKGKGAIKIDGFLTVTRQKSVVTLRKEADMEVIFQGIQNEICRRGFLEVDETVQLGPYEVEILGIVSHSISLLRPSSAQATSEAMTTKQTSTVLLGRNSGSELWCPGNKSKSVCAINRVTSSTTSFSSTPNAGKRSHIRKPPAQPVKKARVQEKDDSIGSSATFESCQDTSTMASVQKENTVAGFSRSTYKHKRNHFPAFKRPLLHDVASKNSSSTADDGLLHRDHTDMSNNKNVHFPGAAGFLDVPHSIKSVLRPHQIDGVTFLWNCLTAGAGGKPFHPQNVRAVPIDSYNHCEANSGNHVSSTRGCILCDEMGLGKTLMTIATITALHRQKRDMRFVVVCPTSLVKNWGQEFTKWLGEASQPRRVVVNGGGSEAVQRIKAFTTLKPNLSEVLVISYDLFRRNVSLLTNIQKVALLIVDEGHRLKNASGSLTMTALKSMRCDARLCITATPVQNNLTDLYTMVDFVRPGLLGDLSTFRRDFERPISSYNDKNCSAEEQRRGVSQSKLLDEIVGQVMLRRLQKDVLNKSLPPKSVFLLFCRPTSEQCTLYRQIAKRHSGGCLKMSGAGASPDALTALMELRKVCAHPRLFANTEDSDTKSDRNGIDILLSGKMTVLDALLQEIRAADPADKVVIVSNFTSTLTVVEDSILKPRQLNYLRLDGSTNATNRQTLVDSFNKTSADRNFALTVSSKAGGIGLNLIGANRLVMVDPDWNPATDIQAMARIHRNGQKKPCYIYRLFTSGTVEEVICQRQIQKGSLATIAVDSVDKSKISAAKLSRQELDDCFSLKHPCRSNTYEKIGGWPDYSGDESLRSQGCSDFALLSIAAMTQAAFPLVFVHTVNEGAEPQKVEDDYMIKEGGKYDDSDEEEYEWQDDDAHHDSDRCEADL